MNMPAGFLYESDLWIGRPREEVFGFFSDASNLQEITPDWLHFQILTPSPMPIRKGALIDYRLKVRGFPLRWRTEITAWEPPVRFVDEQKRGPYKLWIHEHTFFEENGGTRVHDKVHYRPPGGWIVDRLFVRRDVKAIFEFRQRKLRERFGNSRTA